MLTGPIFTVLTRVSRIGPLQDLTSPHLAPVRACSVRTEREVFKNYLFERWRQPFRFLSVDRGRGRAVC